MKTLILCEGKTDAIILSYFLLKKYNWKHVNNREMSKSKYKDIIRFKTNENQSCCLYENGEKLLLIYACGGIEEIPKKINEVADINSQSDFEKRFNKIIVMTDKDENGLNELEIKFNEWINESKIELNDYIKLIPTLLTQSDLINCGLWGAKVWVMKVPSHYEDIVIQLLVIVQPQFRL